MSRSDYNRKARAYFERCGYTAIAKTEVYRVDPPAKGAPPGTKGFGRFHDMFGFIDFLAVGNGETVAAQICRSTDVANRLAKVHASDHIETVLAAGWKVLVIGFMPGISAPHRIVEVTADSVQKALEKIESTEEQVELF